MHDAIPDVLFVTLYYAVIVLLQFTDRIGNLETGRRALASLRSVFREYGAPERILDADDALWSDGEAGRATRNAFALLCVVLSSVHFIDGNLFPVLSALLLGLCHAMTSHDPVLTSYTMAFNTWLQAVTLLLMSRQRSGYYDRALFTCNVGSLMCLEQLDLIVMRTLCITFTVMKIRYDSGFALLSPGMSLFFVFILPMSVMANRGRLAGLLNNRSIKADVGFLVSLPLFFIFLSFSQMSVLCLAMRRHLQSMFPDLVEDFGAWQSVPLWMATSACFVFEGDLLLALVCGLGPMVAVANMPLAARALILPVQLWRIVMLRNSEDKTMILGVAQSLLMFDNFPLGWSMALEFALLGVKLWLSAPSMAFFTVLTTMSAVFGRFASRRSREGALHLLNIDSKAQNFIDHALKQKFVGAGEAIENAILLSPAGSELQDMLSAALAECKFGHDMCHFASVARMIDKGVYGDKASPALIADVVEGWRNKLARDLEFHVINAFGALVQTDWDLLFGLVCKLSARDKNSLVTLELVLDVHPPVLVLAIQRETRVVNKQLADSMRIVSTVLEFLKGSIDQDLRIRIPVKVIYSTKPSKFSVHALSDDSITDMPLSGMYSPVKPCSTVSSDSQSRADPPTSESAGSSYSSTIPPGLVMAVLDDNVLSRRSMIKFCKRQFAVSEKSFARGANLAEAKDFVQEICASKPDVVIFDQHLDYDSQGEGEEILGSDMILQARKLGFDGCILVHTANGLLKSQLDFNVVDGFVEKNLTRPQVKRVEFEHAWANAQKRMRLKSV